MDKAQLRSDEVYDGMSDGFFTDQQQYASPGFACLNEAKEPETSAAISSRQEGSCLAATLLPGG